MKIKVLMRLLIAMIAIGAYSTIMAESFKMPEPGNDLIGKVYTIKAKRGDSFSKLAHQYGLSLHEVVEANPHLRKKLRVGSSVVIPDLFILPKQRKGIVINLAELRLFYFTADGKTVYTYPVALGRYGWRTPTTRTIVYEKKTDPIWNVPKSIREYALEKDGKVLPKQILPGPDNPLGKYAIYLGKTGYLIHGTNQPGSIGMFVSSGCIRMNNPDIEQLYSMAEKGIPVYILHHPVKAGWLNGELYVEAHEPVALDEGISKLNYDSVDRAIDNAVKRRQVQINWKKADRIASFRTGIPEPVGHIVWQPQQPHHS